MRRLAQPRFTPDLKLIPLFENLSQADGSSKNKQTSVEAGRIQKQDKINFQLAKHPTICEGGTFRGRSLEAGKC